MHPNLRGVAEHMRGLGLGALQHALRLSLYGSMENPWWSDLSVLHAAHAAEILLKARIAEEHPLLIFENLPRSTQAAGTHLDFEDLFENGRTVDFQQLPERLWAATGHRLQNVEKYTKFGKVRNAIQHFAPSQADPAQETLEFVFGVIDPFINETWGVYAIDYNEEFGDHYEHIFESLVERDVRPLISPAAAMCWRDLGYEPGDDAPSGYREWFADAMRAALEERE